jgi:hypothetical protein
MDHAQSFRVSDSVEFDEKTALKGHIDTTVAACDNILATIRREDWYKVCGIHIHDVVYC